MPKIQLGLMFRLGVIVCLLISAVVVADSRSEQAATVSAADVTSVFTPMTPQRLVDTRIGHGTPKQRLQAGESVDIQVTGRLGIPSNATAVVANVIAVDADRPGYLQLLPTGQAAFRSSSTLNTDTAGQTIPNAAFAPLGDGGQLTVFAVFTTDVVIDVSGYFTPATSSKAGRLVPLTPTRILDTRISLGWTPTTPLGNLAARIGESVVAETIITLQVAGRGGVPKSGVSAVVMNVTAVDPAGPGYVQVAPTPVVPRATSNLNTAAGRTIANLVVVPLGAGGSVDLFTTINADLVADVVGYFTDSTAPESSKGLFVPIAPNRQLDTRLPAPRTPVPEGTVTTIDISDISPTAIAIAGNLTATEPTGPGYLQLAAPPMAIRSSSNLNISYAGQTIANAVVSPVAGGRVQLYNRFPTHQLLDVTGWFTPVGASLPPTTPPPAPTTTSPPAPTTTSPAPTTTTTTTTVPSPPVARLTYAWQNQIYTINPDGTNQLKLTSGDKNYWPRWSPDGNRIAYVHEAAGAHSLWVMNADGSNKQQVTDEILAYGPTWSPDGVWLAYAGVGGLAKIKSTTPFGTPELLLGGPDPGDANPIIIGGTPVWSAPRRQLWEPSNEIFYYAEGDMSDHAIKAYDVTTGNEREMPHIGGSGGDGFMADPAISRFGNKVGVTITDEAPLIRLYAYTEWGFFYSPTALPFTSLAEDAQLAFSRTDTRVALMNDSTGTAQIIVADADGTNRQFVTNGYQPDWQPRPSTPPDTTPPTLNLPPYAEFVVGTSIGPSTAPINTDGNLDPDSSTDGIKLLARWDANDPSGSCGYDVWGEESAWFYPLLIGTDTTQVERTMTDYTNEFGGDGFFKGYEVTAYDCAGNTTTKFITMRPHVVQEDGSSFNGGGVAFTYNGNWETGTYSGFSGGHTRKTSAEGASVTIDVNPIPLVAGDDGQHVALVMEKAPNRGEAEIYVDGEYATTIDTYSNTTVHRAIVFDVELSAGPHTIEVINKATPGHPRIDLDAVLTNGLFYF